ncbi:sulfotransferase 2B1-like isoform X8 [Epinephelus fuscoguttatus]|uniref:sulfotransferase 2B1-like isoform X8 n=1 Tax=Epinephelus fuscoguttatus TaxID=293821 RepID=UPI0020D159B6|nr:sulfotransferase 2B1-like isoform X8 [Epinephelus fuscoguttatus]
MTEAELYTQYRGVLVPSAVHSPQSLKYYEEFTFRLDDIIIATYPKSGTTWMQEIVPLIMSGGDPASVETLPNWDRVPWLEETRACNLNLEERPSPRMCTTHFLYNMMPPSFFKVKPKVIYVMRNPKDVFTSLFHYHGMASFLSNTGTQNEFLHKFLDGKVMFGSWFDHVKSWLNAEDKEHIMYISYEEMIMDLKDSVARIAQFLQKSLDAEVIEKIADRCLFKNMKKNNMSNYSVVPREIMDQTKSEFLRKAFSIGLQYCLHLPAPSAVETCWWLPRLESEQSCIGGCGAAPMMPWAWRAAAASGEAADQSSPGEPHGQKVINVMRNPKDAFTSLFYYSEMASHWVNPGSQSDYLHKFLDGKVVYGSWFDHVKSWLNADDKEHIMYISYEEMIMDLKDSVARIAQFLQKSLDAEVIEKIADRCLFKNMKKNNMSNYNTVPREQLDQTKSEFLRKGIVGDWKNQLTVAEAEYFDAVFKDKMKDIQYQFVWE